MERRTLTLRPRVDPLTRPKVDPAKVSLSEALQMRYVDRGGRYIFQRLIVTYETVLELKEGAKSRTEERSRTWIDVPLVPEAYIG